MASILEQIRQNKSQSPLYKFRESVGLDYINTINSNLGIMDDQRRRQGILTDAITRAKEAEQEAVKAQTPLAKAGEFVFGGGLKELGKDIARGFVRTGKTFVDILGQRRLPFEPGTPSDTGTTQVFGEPVTSPIAELDRKAKEGTLTGKELAGYVGDAGLEVATTFIAPARMLKFLKGSGVLKNIARGAVEGAAIGGGFGFTGGLEEGKRGSELAKQTGIGALAGAGIGAAIPTTGAVFRGASNVAKKIVDKTLLRNTVKEIEQDLGRLDIQEITMVNEGLKNGATTDDIITGLKASKIAQESKDIVLARFKEISSQEEDLINLLAKQGKSASEIVDNINKQKKYIVDVINDTDEVLFKKDKKPDYSNLSKEITNAKKEILKMEVQQAIEITIPKRYGFSKNWKKQLG